MRVYFRLASYERLPEVISIEHEEWTSGQGHAVFNVFLLCYLVHLKQPPSPGVQGNVSEGHLLQADLGSALGCRLNGDSDWTLFLD